MGNDISLDILDFVCCSTWIFLEIWWSCDKHLNLDIAPIKPYGTHIHCILFPKALLSEICKYIFIYKLTNRWWNNQHVLAIFTICFTITPNICSKSKEKLIPNIAICKRKWKPFAIYPNEKNIIWSIFSTSK